MNVDNHVFAKGEVVRVTYDDEYHNTLGIYRILKEDGLNLQASWASWNLCPQCGGWRTDYAQHGETYSYNYDEPVYPKTRTGHPPKCSGGSGGFKSEDELFGEMMAEMLHHGFVEEIAHTEAHLDEYDTSNKLKLWL